MEVTAFTLLELLVVIAVIGILTALSFPVLSRAKAGAATTDCLNNLRQMQVSWLLYAHDNDDRVPPNLSFHTNGAWRSTPDSWIGKSSAPHDTDATGIEEGLLYKYDYNRKVSVYVCPADKSEVRTIDGQQLGLRRTRSYSMSGCFGGRTNDQQTTVNYVSDVPQPSQVFVFIDEQEESIDDAHFLVWSAPDDRWVNLPADRHRRGANLSFVDGHAEYWRWRNRKTFGNKPSYWKPSENSADLADLRRLQKAIITSEE